MTDIVTPAVRSRMMSGIRGKDTKPEVLLRRRLHALGLRYRLHVTGLPGQPDLVFPRWKAVVFVNGCFWHRHPGCRYATTPATRREFWESKFAATVARDNANQAFLVERGWRVLIVWECVLRGAAIDQTVHATAEFVKARDAGCFQIPLTGQGADTRTGQLPVPRTRNRATSEKPGPLSDLG